jgi:hypothetical protein
MKELESDRKLVLLAPLGARIPGPYRCIEQNDDRYSELLRQLQALRGRIMVEECVITEDHLDESGCHKAPADFESWHLLIMHNGRVSGCARYLVHPSNVMLSELVVKRTANFGCENWAKRVSAALQRELGIARRHAFSLVEFGGWALAKELRGTSEAARMALASYAFCQIAGGCFGLTTATVQHGSSSILRRIGGRSLVHEGEAIPRYYDPEYNCEMEMLRFDSRQPNPKYLPLLKGIRASLLSTPIICRSEATQLSWAS